MGHTLLSFLKDIPWGNLFRFFNKWMGNRQKRERVYHLFMDEVCHEGSYYCTKPQGVISTGPRKAYLNPEADFSSYDFNDGFTTHHLTGILKAPRMEAIHHQEMSHRVGRLTSSEVLYLLKTEHPEIHTNLKTLFERGWCYRYEIQKAFKIPTTYPNPFIL